MPDIEVGIHAIAVTEDGQRILVICWPTEPPIVQVCLRSLDGNRWSAPLKMEAVQ